MSHPDPGYEEEEPTGECMRCGEPTDDGGLVGDESYEMCDICRDDMGA